MSVVGRRAGRFRVSVEEELKLQLRIKYGGNPSPPCDASASSQQQCRPLLSSRPPPSLTAVGDATRLQDEIHACPAGHPPPLGNFQERARISIHHSLRSLSCCCTIHRHHHFVVLPPPYVPTAVIDILGRNIFPYSRQCHHT